MKQQELDAKLGERTGKEHTSYTAQLETHRLKPPDQVICDHIAEILEMGAEAPKLWSDFAAPERMEAFDPGLFKWHQKRIADQNVFAIGPDEQRLVETLRRMASQLISRWKHEPWWSKGPDDDAGPDVVLAVSSYMSHLLERTVATLMRDAEERPTVVGVFLFMLELMRALPPHRRLRMWAQHWDQAYDTARDLGVDGDAAPMMSAGPFAADIQEAFVRSLAEMRVSTAALAAAAAKLPGWTPPQSKLPPPAATVEEEEKAIRARTRTLAR